MLYPLSTINKIWLTNVKRVKISNLNINSVPSKFNQMKQLVLKHMHVLVLTDVNQSLIECQKYHN